MAPGSKGKPRHPLETLASKRHGGLGRHVSLVERACTSCTGLGHALIRLSQCVQRSAWPDCQLGLPFCLAASVNEPRRG